MVELVLTETGAMTLKNRKPPGRPPALGEEVALQGYDAQYLVAAELIVLALRNSAFEAVTLKDSGAEKVDDVQVIYNRRVDAYQIKWHDPPTTLTPSAITGPETDPLDGLLRQLADGWKAIGKKHQNKEVFVHLYTSSAASTANISDISAAETPPRHLAEFLRAYWGVPAPSNAVLHKWRPFIERLKRILALTDAEFELFRTHCVFDLNRRSPQQREDFAINTAHYTDIDDLQAAITRFASRNKGPIILGRKAILELAGWTDRFAFKSRHEFPITKYYVAIEETVNDITTALQTYHQGYLALVGSPGSGKSTLLTNTLNYKPQCRVLRYYCYIPDDTALYRGEAFNFLHDVVLTLWAEGIRPTGHTVGDSIERLRATFSAQLDEIGRLWDEQGIVTIVLVDGLDHVKREEDPQRSLLKELPVPTAVPNGCLFVLGSQTLDGLELHPRISQQLNEANSARTIRMRGLSRRAIREIAKARLPTISFADELLDSVEVLSAGHPLALNYLLNRLGNVEPNQLSAVLENTPPYAEFD